jgi:hypothetical protein
METVRYSTDEWLDPAYMWRIQFLSAGWYPLDPTPPEVNPHPPSMAIENLREILYHDGAIVLDEGYYDASGTLQHRIGSKTTYSILGAIVTEWVNGPYKLERYVGVVDPSLGMWPITYRIYHALEHVGLVGIGVVYRYEEATGTETIWDAASYIVTKMEDYYTTHVGSYWGIIDPSLTLEICYSCDDTMKQLSDYSVELWDGATPVDFLSAGIPYIQFSPTWTGITNQLHGSKAIWGIVHLPTPNKLVVETCTINPFQGVGPINRYTQYTHVTYRAHIPVGGIWVPINKYDLLAPWIGLASVIASTVAVSVVYVRHRKKQQT